MSITDTFYTFFMYLIHPYKSHAFLSDEEDTQFLPQKLGVYESLATSWVFIVINGILKIWLINLVLFSFYNFADNSEGILDQFYIGNGLWGFYFLILSTILNMIFYPIISLVIVQFWEFVIKSFASLLDVEGDLSYKAQSIIAVAFSSNLLMIVPVFGEVAQKFISFFLMYAGLRKQLNTSFVLSICILFTPVVLVLGFVSILLFIALIL